MKHNILCIGEIYCNQEKIKSDVGADFPETPEWLFCDNLTAAEPFLFERKISVIIAETRSAEITEFIKEMKLDELFMDIPAIGIVEKKDPAAIYNLLLSGFDYVVFHADIELLLFPYLHNLLHKAERQFAAMQKISDLQDNEIKNFIQLDLVKCYIPVDLWSLVKDYAHQQKIVIPEEELDLTVVFGDLQGFTPKTQMLKPPDVIAYLNKAFDLVTRYVYDYSGDIDKFIGDAFLAIFKTPAAAVDSMLRLQKEFKENNAQRKGELPIIFRIGIHTGPVIRGNVGGNERFDNTLIGDTVNIAARLEGLATPGELMISEATNNLLPNPYPSVLSQTVGLKGRTGKINVFSIPV